MREQQNVDSSFDLFLDTICNTFGGIVFLAILLAIMIQSKSVIENIEPTNETRLSADEYNALSQDLESLQNEYETVTKALASLPRVQSDPEDLLYTNDIKELEEKIDTQTTLVKNQLELSKAMAVSLRENASLRETNESIPKQLETAINQFEELKKKHQAAANERQVTMKMPVERETNLRTSLAILKNSRFVFVGSASQLSNGSISNEVVLENTQDNGLKFTPKPGAGKSVSDNAVVRRIESVKANSEILTLAVWPDSYAEFAQVKEVLLQKNVLYQLWPQRLGEELVVYRGSGPNRAQ